MRHFYIFLSSKEDDVVRQISIFTNSLRKAYAYAYRYFAQHNCEGVPKLLAI